MYIWCKIVKGEVFFCVGDNFYVLYVIWLGLFKIVVLYFNGVNYVIGF